MFGSDVAKPAGRPQDGLEDDDSGGFAHCGWSVNYWDEQMKQVMDEAISTPFDLVLGRKTYVGRHHPSGLKLVDSTVSTTGVVIGTYEPAGEIVPGSFALD
ncbi:MAG: hypothetical protein ABI323_13175 [Solirubrobacteraceae bacterium]